MGGSAEFVGPSVLPEKRDDTPKLQALRGFSGVAAKPSTRWADLTNVSARADKDFKPPAIACALESALASKLRHLI